MSATATPLKPRRSALRVVATNDGTPDQRAWRIVHAASIEASEVKDITESLADQLDRMTSKALLLAGVRG